MLRVYDPHLRPDTHFLQTPFRFVCTCIILRGGYSQGLPKVDNTIKMGRFRPIHIVYNTSKNKNNGLGLSCPVLSFLSFPFLFLPPSKRGFFFLSSFLLFSSYIFFV